MSQFNVAEAKARFSELVQKAVSGEEVVIARDNRPLLRLVPLARRRSAPAGLREGKDLDGPGLRPDAGGLRGLRRVRLLLDTHAFLWWVGATRGLSRKARSAIGNGRNECLVSIATAWEIAIKVSLGSLRVEGPSTASCPSRSPPTASGRCPSTSSTRPGWPPCHSITATRSTACSPPRPSRRSLRSSRRTPSSRSTAFIGCGDSPAMSILVVENLVKTYPGTRKAPPVEAVRGVSFTVERGEFFGLLGPNGAGKSTTIGCISTLVRPTSGRILVDGVDVARQPHEAKRRIAVVPQARNLDRDLSVREVLTYHGRYFGLRPKSARRGPTACSPSCRSRTRRGRSRSRSRGTAAARDDRARADARSEGGAPRRAHDRPRPPGPAAALGDACASSTSAARPSS